MPFGHGGGVRDPGLPDLSGSVALVTGASGGIGAGIAARFAAAGAAVVVGYRTGARRADAVVRDIEGAGGTALAVPADLGEQGGGEALVDVAVRRFGRLDAVVGAAGVQPVETLATMRVQSWRAVLEGNLTVAFHTVAAAAPVLGPGGSITLIASIEGSAPAPGHAHYASAKAGVIMLARAAAAEHAGSGIRVNTVSPGLVHRPGIEQAWPDGVARWRRAAPLGRLGTPTDVGDACVYLASPMARWVTGHDLVVDGGVSAGPGW